VNWLVKDDLSKLKKLPRSWTALNRLIREEGFPPGHIAGRNRIWLESSVDDWLLSRSTDKSFLRGRAKTLVEGARPPEICKGPGGVSPPTEAKQPKPPSTPTNISDSAPASQEHQFDLEEVA
jgi:hypothetical protein